MVSLREDIYFLKYLIQLQNLKVKKINKFGASVRPKLVPMP